MIIKAIEICEINDTYDIWNMEDDCYLNEGNFILDDIVVHNSIPEAVSNRNEQYNKGDNAKWRSEIKKIHPILLEILSDTYGIIVWQEQLANIWQRLGEFSSTEAQEARKAVAKKWGDKLKNIEKKWLDGASKTIGIENAKKYLVAMLRFARYAFNKSHGVAYCLVAYRSMFLKRYYPAEWWASVMSNCNQDKLTRYMGVARAEGVEFDTLNINNLTESFTVTGDTINQGLISVKGLGTSACAKYAGKNSFTSITEFVEKYGPDKKVMERLIKLGSFKKYHKNTKAAWLYYQFMYGKCYEAKSIKKRATEDFLTEAGWTASRIKEEINRQISEYKANHPKRNKIPPKILNFKPTIQQYLEYKKKDKLEVEDFERYGTYTLAEILNIEKEYLGYYINSPLDLYRRGNGLTIEEAKEKSAQLENRSRAIERSVPLSVIVNSFTEAISKNNNKYGRLLVSDGLQQALVFMWMDHLYDKDGEKRQSVWNLLKPNTGILINAIYDKARGSFTLADNDIIKLYAK